MEYSLDDILKDVRVAMDENCVSQSLIDTNDNDTLTIDQIISKRLLDAIKSVSLSSPAHLLEGIYITKSEIIAENDVYYIALPDDFLRIVSVKMNEWKRAVFEIIYEYDPRYFLQKSNCPGIRGSINKPICAFVERFNKKVLELYPSGTLQYIKYIPTPDIVDFKVDISKNIYDSVIFYTAALTDLSLSGNKNEFLFKLSNDLLKK